MEKGLTELPTIPWMGYNWYQQETWGQVHPVNNWQWYNPDCVEIIEDDENGDQSLLLHTKYKPKKFAVYEPNSGQYIDVFPQTAIGLVRSKEEFHFGYYRIIAKLPVGEHLWSAIWGWGGDWEREIDIMEGYTNKNGSYFRCGYPFWKIWKLQSNFHYKDDKGKHHAVGAKNMFVGFRNPANRFITYEMIWMPDSIKIYIDGKLRRTLKGDVMQYFQKPIHFLFNNGVRKEHPVGSPVSTFTIKHFKYIEK